MSNNSLYEITTLLYDVVDRLSRIEKHLGVEPDNVKKENGVPFKVINTDEKVLEFPRKD